MPVFSSFLPRTDYSKLSPEFFHAVSPAKFPKTELRFWNDRWAKRIGLGELSETEKIRHFARFEPFEAAQTFPLAMKYHGDQFRHYNPQIGDGRGFLFAQLEDPVDHRLLDLGTKGSGQTPYSRGGDGRLTLKGAVREALATEMLEALGVNTSKTFSFFETGEHLHRGDEPSPTRSAVLTRLSHGHIRYGTFQRLAFRNEVALMNELVAYSIRVYFPELKEVSEGERQFIMLERIIAGAADLAASWMIAGFVHGVLNTDNMNITGESFDYGPWRFLPFYDPPFTAAYFDHEGLYAYSRQPEAVYWNLDRLARSLHVMVPSGQEAAWQERFVSLLENYPVRFQRSLIKRFFDRLGLVPPSDEKVSEELFVSAFSALAESKSPYEEFFYDWYGGSCRAANDGGKANSKYNSPKAVAFASSIAAMIANEIVRQKPETAGILKSDYYTMGTAESMLIDEVESIWRSIDKTDDWAPFHAKIASVRERGRVHGFGG